jgi:glyoxylase-like metal-dependent hydrolase (beta-lactamase superfamily II)
LLTHTHNDHAAGVAALQQATGAPVVGRYADFAGADDETLAIDRLLSDGDTISVDGLVLNAIHTPGHASNHLCYLLNATRMLFTGDHIMQGSTVVIGPPDGNLRAYLQSLRRLLSVDIAILAPGHGYLIGRPHFEVERLVNHRLAREGKVRKAMLATEGRISVEELVPRVYDDVPASLHAFAAYSLRAHLEKLVEDGEIRCSDGAYSRA